MLKASLVFVVSLTIAGCAVRGVYPELVPIIGGGVDDLHFVRFPDRCFLITLPATLIEVGTVVEITCPVKEEPR